MKGEDLCRLAAYVGRENIIPVRMLVSCRLCTNKRAFYVVNIKIFVDICAYILKTFVNLAVLVWFEDCSGSRNDVPSASFSGDYTIIIL